MIDGPEGWIGREVFGSSGDLGIRRDGTHATHLVVEAEAVVEKPKSISWRRPPGSACRSSPRWKAAPGRNSEGGRDRAGHGRQRQGRAGGDQIATWHGARVIGVVRRAEPNEGHGNSHVEVIDASATDVAARVRESLMARAPTSYSTRSAIPISRPRTNRWRCAGGRS